MSFKLIAIRPLKECAAKYLKNLKENQLYRFYNYYTFAYEQDDPEKEVTGIALRDKAVIDNLYDLEWLENGLTGEPRKIAVSISAIVGKNGSGKSSLSELLLACLFLISNKTGFVNADEFIDENDEEETLDRYLADIKELETGLHAELYYSIDTTFVKIRIDGNRIQKEAVEIKQNAVRFDRNYTEIIDKHQLQPFFYSMIINYSIYSFNTNLMGMWIKAVFHKNDGYQMPVVINPYKRKGNTDINVELYLTRARVLSNLITISDYRITLNPKSGVEKVVLYYDKNKNYEGNIDDVEKEDFKRRILGPLFSRMFNGERSYPVIETNIQKKAEYYVIHKLKSITEKYLIFKDYKDILSQDVDEKFLKAIFQNRTHITLKVFQTLNFLNDNLYYDFPNLDLTTTLDFGLIRTKIEQKRNQSWFTEPVEYLPPPFLFSKIVFSDNSTFDDLSSGEKQKIFSLSSILYHASNVDSVSRHHSLPKEERPIVYKNINLILDEIELYYHPEFQRNFISDLLKLLREARFSSINKINIVFLTHSPFILSDIPVLNILFLEGTQHTGEQRIPKMLSTPVENVKQTFAANIHELFRDGFFMHSTKGAFALSKIDELLEFCKQVRIEKDNMRPLSELRSKYLKRQQYFRNLIDMIGEDYIRNVLENHLDELEFTLDVENTNKAFLEKKAAELEAELTRIRNKMQ